MNTPLAFSRNLKPPALAGGVFIKTAERTSSRNRVVRWQEREQIKRRHREGEASQKLEMITGGCPRIE